MKTILVPLDGSTCAEQVLPYVQHLAPLMNARIQFLRVVPDEEVEPILVESVAAFGDIDRFVSDRHRRQEVRRIHYEQAADYLAAQASLFWRTKDQIDLDVRVGSAAEAIIEAASEPDVVLIAMATHDDNGLRRWVRGSIADRVVHATTTPVLLVRRGPQATAPKLNLKHILMPLDGSSSSAAAVPLATSLAGAANASLTVLQVVPPTLGIAPDRYSDDDEQPTYHALLTALHSQAMTELHVICAGLQERGVRATPIVATGNPAEAIVDVAQRRSADLIVMATHGATGPRRWVLGSVADKVLHTNTIPLLLVPIRAHT